MDIELDPAPLPTDPDERADILRSARMMTLVFQPISDAGKELASSLVEQVLDYERRNRIRLRKRTKLAEQQLHKTVGALSADLIAHAGNRSAIGFGYRSSEQDSLSETVTSRRSFNAVRSAFIHTGLAQHVKGFQSKSDWDGETINGKGWAARYRATNALLHRAQEFGIKPSNIEEHFRPAKDGHYQIALRQSRCRGSSGTGRAMKFERSGVVAQLAEEVRQLNASMQQHTFSFGDPPSFRRIFNNGNDPGFSWNMGGRLVAVGGGNYQHMKAGSRRHITIDGKRTVEIDIRSSQLTIAYGLTGTPLPSGDPYDLKPFPRDVVKALITAQLGKGGRVRRWPDDIREKFKQRTGQAINDVYPLRLTQTQIERQHPILGSLNAHGIHALKLQYVESEVLMQSLTTLRHEYHEVALPLHDCLIVKDDEKTLFVTESLITKHFKALVGVEPTLVRKE